MTEKAVVVILEKTPDRLMMVSAFFEAMDYEIWIAGAGWEKDVLPTLREISDIQSLRKSVQNVILFAGPGMYEDGQMTLGVLQVIAGAEKVVSISMSETGDREKWADINLLEPISLELLAESIEKFLEERS